VSATVAAIRQRARLNATIRAFFDQRGYVEVETPAIALSPGLEPHLDAVGVTLREGMGGSPVQRWLITSPEYHCKRLLGRGMTKIYRLGKAFRSGECGPLHNPEFTMLEWYRVGANHLSIAAETLALIDACNLKKLPLAPPLQRSFDTLITRHAGFDCLPLDDAQMLRNATEANYPPLTGESAADLLMRAWVDRAEPALPDDGVVIVDRYPARLASLARLAADDARIAERVEVFLCGVELANGFSELIDPVEQRARFEADLAHRKATGLPQYPIDERFLDALAHCPEAAGIALGVDRLLMVLGGYGSLSEVLAFPFESA
jgi:elongation factor P--(R)-beta-lysine ligase